jgi:glycosyltransferase involved in cell wall biosynthesis
MTLIGCDKIIATNSEIMGILENRMPSLLKKTYWIPIASNIPRIGNCFKNSQVPTPVISYFGMLYEGKGLKVILDTIAHLKDRGIPFKFKIIGGGMIDHENYEERIKSEIKNRSLTDFVDWVGLVSADIVSEELSQSRVIFLPYDSGLSDRRGSFMAAIAHGRPVLTSPPIVEMSFLKNGMNALWPQKPTSKHYAQLLEKLLTDDNLISKLSKGACLLGCRFNWDQIARDHERVFSGLR